MKHLMVLLISILFSATSFAKDLHFVYVRLDNSMNTEKLKAQIEKLKTDFAGNDFVLYYGNGQTTMDGKSWDSKKLFGLIDKQNSAKGIGDIPDEIENISLSLEKQLQKESYNAIYFDCFVGNKFFLDNSQNDVFARMLIVNSLVQSKYQVVIRYFPCGATYTAQKTKFNPEYNIHFPTQIILSL